MERPCPVFAGLLGILLLGWGMPLAAQDWVSSGLVGGGVRSLVRHPGQPTEVMLSTGHAGPYHSMDDGRSWSPAMAGLGGTIAGWRAAPVGTGGWLAFHESVAGLFRLERSPSRWGLIPGSPSVGSFLERLRFVVMAPSLPNRVYAISTGGLVFRSEDAGERWSRVGQIAAATPEAMSSAAVSHQDPDLLLVSTSNGLQRSLNGGTQWTFVSPADASLAQRSTRIVLDPASNAGGYLITWPRVRGLQAQGAGLFDPPALPGTAVDRFLDASFGTHGPWFVRPPVIHAPAAAGGWQALNPPELEVAPGRRASALYVEARRRPGQADAVLIGTDGPGVYASADGGGTWQLANTGLDSISARAMAVAPGLPSLVLAGQGEQPSPTPTSPATNLDSGYRALFRSLDGPTGNWQPARIPLRFVRDIVFDPRNTGALGTMRIFAVGAGVFRSEDGGENWIDLGGRSEALGGFPHDPGTVRRLVFTGEPDTVVVAAGSGVYRSTNLGATWTQVSGGLLMLTLARDPVDANVLYLGTVANFQQTSQRIPNVYRSSDSGLTWTATGTNGLPDPLPSSGSPFFEHWSAYAIAVHPQNPETLWIALGQATERGRIYRSDDAGVNWYRADSGLGGSDSRDLVVDPNNGMHLLAARWHGVLSSGSPLYRSLDGGQSWRAYGGSLHDLSGGATRVLFDPNDSSRILIGTNRGVFARQLLPDADQDGVADSIEDAAPFEGDGNQDQIADRLQSEVVSLPLSGGPWPGAGMSPNGRLTIWSEAVQGECDRLEDARTLPAQAFPSDRSGPQSFAHPLGLIAFELRRCQVADVFFRVHGADFTALTPSVRLYGSPDSVISAAARWFASPGIQSVNASDTIRVRLSSSVPGNTGGDPDSIRFTGSLALRDDMFANGFEGN